MLYVDETRSAIDIKSLINENRLLRIISSDKRGEGAYVVEEYLDDSVYIPIVNPKSAAPVESTPSLINRDSTSKTGNNADLDHQILLQSLEVAKLKLQVGSKQYNL